MNERELFELQEEVSQYKYFVLKNGSRTTSYRTPSAKVGNIENYIKTALEIYPEGAEIYQISLEEHLAIQRLNRERRRIFRRIKARNTQYKEFDGRNDEHSISSSNETLGV